MMDCHLDLTDRHDIGKKSHNIGFLVSSQTTKKTDSWPQETVGELMERGRQRKRSYKAISTLNCLCMQLTQNNMLKVLKIGYQMDHHQVRDLNLSDAQVRQFQEHCKGFENSSDKTIALCWQVRMYGLYNQVDQQLKLQNKH